MYSSSNPINLCSISIHEITRLSKTKKIFTKCSDHVLDLAEHIFSVRPDGFRTLLNAGEVHEVAGPVYLMVELLGVGECQLVAHVRVVSHTHEVVIPRTLTNKAV